MIKNRINKNNKMEKIEIIKYYVKEVNLLKTFTISL